MPHKRGFRHGTRQKLHKPFRRAGAIRMNNYLRPNRIGDYVDIMIDSAIHKGLPHYFYHGKTGIVSYLNKL